ncbi:hypothetical protein GCK72_007580 [Caenorhabditis remanei]|uniref:SCP domain-containing protein n=1 Tax=Caenorhabditis remanei TaxID=31234 RepID=A0A6A5HKH1_CAERE|nr:hypothetical protein GCK72_007580 [Caenorhabditis remanei]KAF1767621.1 hypothetical protein GCK72_007580 [Caenorhabditis remanei]
MHELMWSEELLDILKPLDWHGDWPESRRTWRYTRVDSFDGAELNIEKEMNILLGKNGEAGKQDHINGHDDDSFGIMEFLNPLQKFFACALINDTSTNLAVQVCLLGPQGRVALFDTSKNQSNYVPGSKCDRRYKNDKKLCVALRRWDESYQGSQEDFVEDVNQIRKQYANKFSVHNMHQLIWSEDLVKTLESFEYTNPRPDAPQTTWRYTAITTYSEKPYIEYELKKFFEDSVESQEKQIDEQVDKTVWLLEFLNPRQKFIGCGPKPDGNRMVIVCLMGPEGNYTHLNSTRLSNDTPELECDDGYKQYNGLCSIPTTTTTEKPDEQSFNPENPPQKTKPTAAPQVASAGNQIHKFYVVIFVVSWLFAF